MSNHSIPRGNAPDLIDPNSAARKIISAKRQPVHGKDCLVGGKGRRTMAGSKGADEEYERRNEIRQVYQELSRYYPLEEGNTKWSTPQLLLKGEYEFQSPGSRHFPYLTLLQYWKSSRIFMIPLDVFENLETR